jgi:hypothetical protein
MKDLPQHQTISYSSKGNLGQYTLQKPPEAAHISYRQEIVGRQYGWVKIISPQKRWSESWNRCYVLTQCTGCGRIQWTDLGSLRRGKSRGCQHCSQPRKIPVWLDRRLTAAKQRCTNPKDRNYPNYGGRGIKFEFPSVTEAGLYLIRTFGLPSREMEIDRINNNGNYAPGNIRFATRRQNQANRRNTVLSEFHQKYWPYARSVVIKKLSQGMDRTGIIESAELAVKEKRKNWRLIEARLEFMTYEMPESIIVLPYREN